MKKILFASMVAALALTSCSNDEVINEQNDANKIAFSVVTQGNSRANDIYCPNNLIDGFTVSAKMGGATFFDGDQYTGTTGSWTSNSPVRYWPASGSLDFFASNGTYSWNSGAPTFDDFTVNSSVASQFDLLYAVAAGETKKSTPVQLNFRHALSQIVFCAKNVSPTLYVEVEAVRVVNVHGTGTFTFPTASTTTNVAHGTASGTVPAAQGTWDEANFSNLTDYTASFDTKTVNCPLGAENGGIVKLTEYAAAATGAHGTETDFSNAMLLLPQTKEKAVFEAGKTLPTTGVYFAVKCKLYNVANPNTNGTKADADVLLYPAVAEGSTAAATQAAEIFIPVSIDWKQGMKYIYTLVFGKGDGGWTPDPEPVFVPITFEVSVDEFIPAGNEDVDLTTK